MKVQLSVILICVLPLAACIKPPTAEPTPVPQSGSNKDGFNLLVVAEGNVQLKREGWSDFHPTVFGTELNRGDQLRLAEDAKAVVLCDGLTLWFVPAGGWSGLTNGCPQPLEPALQRPQGRIVSPRGENDPMIPYIISPRSTYLLGEKPTLRWNSVPGVARYQVRVRGENVVWEQSTDASEIIYPGHPALEPGQLYLLSVEADDGTSSLEENSQKLGFILLGRDEALAVRTGQAKLNGLNLPASAEVYAQAKLYSSHGLIAEAIDMLEAATAAGGQPGVIYRTLGDLYRRVGLNRLAEERYVQAITFTQNTNDPEGQALAQLGLGEVTEALGRREESTRWLIQSLAGFKQLGDAEHIAEVNQWLAQATP